MIRPGKTLFALLLAVGVAGPGAAAAGPLDVFAADPATMLLRTRQECMSPPAPEAAPACRVRLTYRMMALRTPDYARDSAAALQVRAASKDLDGVYAAEELGAQALARGEPRVAAALFQGAMSRRRSLGGDPGGRADTALLLARALYETGELPAARSAVDELLAPGSGAPPAFREDAQLMKARILLAEGAVLEARDLLDPIPQSPSDTLGRSISKAVLGMRLASELRDVPAMAGSSMSAMRPIAMFMAQPPADRMSAAMELAMAADPLGEMVESMASSAEWLASLSGGGPADRAEKLQQIGDIIDQMAKQGAPALPLIDPRIVATARLRLGVALAATGDAAGARDQCGQARSQAAGAAGSVADSEILFARCFALADLQTAGWKPARERLLPLAEALSTGGADASADAPDLLADAARVELAAGDAVQAWRYAGSATAAVQARARTGRGGDVAAGRYRQVFLTRIETAWKAGAEP